MSLRSEPKVVVITGASAGVGRATARAFGALGARIGLLARSRERLEQAKLEIELAGGEALVKLEPRAIAVLGCWLLLVHYLDSY
jgi:NADP-dependent 3-hydroxy acid dehydrogenase YdfG